MPTFKVKDLMINVIPERLRGGGSGSSLCADSDASTDHTPITPWTPVIMTAKLTSKFRVLDRVAAKADQLELEAVDRLAVDVGRAAVAARFLPGAALCTQDMATCEGNPRISPLASIGDGLQLGDLAEIRAHLSEAVQAIEKVEGTLEKRAIREGERLATRLEDAANSLRRTG